MTRRLLTSYLAITILVLAVLEIPLGVLFARTERRNLVSELKHDALSLGAISEETLVGNASDDLQLLARDYEADTEGRVVITDADGTLIADSSVRKPDPRAFESRPEISAALAGREVTGTRRSDTLDSDLLYVAVPVTSSGDIVGAVRITYTPARVEELVRRSWFILALIGLIVLAVTTLLSVLLARSLARPIRHLEGTARRLAEGDLEVRAEVPSGPHEVRALSDAFNTMAARLEQLVRSQGEFVADASHQLRTPLQALRLRLENAEAAAGDEAGEDLRGALTEVARLGLLVEGLLTLARAEQQPPARVPVDVGNVVSGRRDAWVALAAERGIELRADIPKRALRAISTPGSLEQVLDNLIANALDASPEGSAVDVAARRANGWIEVHVTDRGPGMTPDERARASDRFWRAPSSRGRGSGLGLAIVRRLTEIDSGTLDLREGEDGGLDVVVRLRPHTR